MIENLNSLESNKMAYALRSTRRPLVVAGVHPPGGWVPYSKGVYVYKCKGDGNCFWRAAAVQMYGDQDTYIRVRREVVAYVKRTPDLHIQDLPLALALEASGFASLDEWIEATLTDSYFGGFIEAALLALCYNYRVEVVTGAVPSLPATQVFNPDGKLALRFYFNRAHYDAIFVTI